jgi:hypothetical protein
MLPRPIRLAFRGMLAALLCTAAVLASGCLPEPPPSPTPEPSATATVTPTPTPTIVWFPPTVTPTPAPTRLVEPTPDVRPSLGDVLLREPFTDKTQWQTARTEAGSAAYGNNELTLAVSKERGLVMSLRKAPQLTNFYLELDAQPSLCRGSDAYGLLLRAETGQDFYRFLANCAGEVRMERVKNSQMVVLQDWMPSGQVQPGGFLPLRIGVAAQGQDLQLFINGVYQFGVRDPVFTQGVVGVVARSSGDTPLTVNFSNMMVYEIDAAPVPTPGPTIVAPSPTPR